MLYLLIKVLSHASAKKKTERLKGFKFCTLIGRFHRHYGSERVKLVNILVCGGACIYVCTVVYALTIVSLDKIYTLITIIKFLSIYQRSPVCHTTKERSFSVVLTARYGLEDIFDPIILGLDPSVQVIIIIIGS